MGSIDANATVATRHTEHATVEHGVQQMGGGIRRAAPVVRHRAVREMVVDLAWVYRAAFAYELQQEIRLLLACSRPRPAAIGRDAGIGARMHQRL